jgi:hypothetical protein
VDDTPSSDVGVIGTCLIVAGVAAVSLAIRIVLVDEAASDRTQALVVIAAVAGFLVTLPVAYAAKLWGTRVNRVVRALAGGLLVGGGFAPAMAVVFAVYIRTIMGHIDSEPFSPHWYEELLWSHIGAMGLFTPMAPKYLLPLTWPAVAVAAALCFLVWPVRRR